MCVCVYMCGYWSGQDLAMRHALTASQTRCIEPRCVSMNNSMSQCKQREREQERERKHANIQYEVS